MQGSRGSACSKKMKLLSEIKKFFNREDLSIDLLSISVDDLYSSGSIFRGS